MIDTLRYPLDTEHGSLRLVIFGAFIAAWVIGFIIIAAIMNTVGINMLALFGGFLFAYGVTYFLERFLKTRWTSGRSLEVQRDGLRTLIRGQVQSQVLAEDPVNLVFWRFVIEKRTRIPKGYSMLACALESEDGLISVYTFMSPKTFDAYPDRDLFKRLMPKKRPSLTDDGREDLRLAGEQRRLREAEDKRYAMGAEMTNDDFTAFIAQLQLRFREWIPTAHGSS